MLSLAFLFFPPAVLAQTSNPYLYTQSQGQEFRKSLEERKPTLQQMKENLKERIEQKRATQEARLSQIRQERIRFFWQRLRGRLLATIERLEKLIARIESRLAKIKSANPNDNTSKVEAAIKQAKISLQQQKDKIVEADEEVEELLGSNDPKEAFKKVRKTVGEIKLALIQIHRKLVQIIRDIKGLRVGQTDNKPTTTLKAGARISPTPTTPVLTPTHFVGQ